MRRFAVDPIPVLFVSEPTAERSGLTVIVHISAHTHTHAVFRLIELKQHIRWDRDKKTHTHTQIQTQSASGV